MKEVNQPNEEQPNVVVTKKERAYIALTVTEINNLLDNYRSALKLETVEFRDVLIEKIKELERELRRRSIKTN